jgi:Lon protease-like protein
MSQDTRSDPQGQAPTAAAVVHVADHGDGRMLLSVTGANRTEVLALLGEHVTHRLGWGLLRALGTVEDLVALSLPLCPDCARGACEVMRAELQFFERSQRRTQSRGRWSR